MAIADKITKANNGVWAMPATLTTSKNDSDVTAGISVATGWPVDATDGPVHFKLFKVDTAGDMILGSDSDHKGTLSGVTLSNIVQTGGPDVNYVVGDPCIIYPTPGFWNDLYSALTASHNKDGSLKQAAILSALGISSNPSPDWTLLPYTPNTVTYNGNGSYDLVFNGVDLTPTLHPGTRGRSTRAVAAPTQALLLNGITQFMSKATPNKMTWTDDFAIDSAITMTSNTGSSMNIVSFYNGTNGWRLYVTSTGQVVIIGYNGSSSNFSYGITAAHSVPLNKKTRISAQLDMSAFTNTATTTYIMINGIDVPVTVSRGGTNPTSLVQATGSLQVGAAISTEFFPGYISQLAIFNSKVTQATMRSYHSQGYIGTETNLVSAWSFNGVATDLNTTTPNDLAPAASAGYAVHSMFGTQSNNTVNTTLDYNIVSASTFSTNTTVTVQVPEGCTIPTTASGVSSFSYSSAKTPNGFPIVPRRWRILYHSKLNASVSTPAANVWYNGVGSNGGGIVAPIGEWRSYYKVATEANRASNTTGEIKVTLSTTINSETDNTFTAEHYHASNVASIQQIVSVTSTNDLTATAQTPYYLNIMVTAAGLGASIRGDLATTIIALDNALL